MLNLSKFSNADVARLLREVAAAYEARGSDRYHLIAYRRAADTIERLGVEVKDLWDEGKIEDIPGVGKSLAAYLDEYFRRGEVAHFRRVKKGLPPGMFKILAVPGVGPKSAYKIAKTLRVKSITDLKKACLEGKVARLEGFGERSQSEILRGIAEVEGRAKRLLLSQAWPVAEKVVKHLKTVSGVRRVDPMGSLRRMAATVGDVDIAVAADRPGEVVAEFTALPGVSRILTKGRAKASVVLGSGIQVDLRVQNPNTYGAQLQYFTGSKNHNIHLRTIANETGLSLSEYGIKDLKDRKAKIKKFKTEAAFYEYLGMRWIPPELREDCGEIEAAREDRLPKLVELKDLKGDLHVHCNFPMEESHDPGLSSPEAIVEKALDLGYAYVGLANHSPSVGRHTQKQIKRLIERKSEAVARLQSRYKNIKLLNVLEVDILADKGLALADEALKRLDFVLVGVHSSLRQSRKEMTERILTALENPYVHALAHPTNRLLLERESSAIDWERIFEACRGNKKILEINAYPNRLDLPDNLVREAVRRGIKLIIGTDAHKTSQMGLMPYGIAVARRGWAEKKDIVNTLPWGKFRDRFGLRTA